MNIKIINNEEQYQKALNRLEEIFLAEANSKKGIEARSLARAITDYEDEHYPIEAPDPGEAMKFRKAQMNLSKEDPV